MIYGDSGWKDLLTSYDGQAVTSDEIGNPLSYRDGMEFTWEGHQLQAVSAGGKDISYAYNSDGIRTGKTVDGVTTSYLLDGSTVIAQKTGDDVLWFLYDSDGTRVGFTYNGAAYYYMTNAQGDVTGIVDSSVNSVVEYSYDAWGKLLTMTGSMADTVGKINPFLYRGYYYDSETGLYYLNSRYYDPQTGRFINADGQLNPDTGLTGNNLFAYCNNNPVSMVDDGGSRPIYSGSLASETDEERAASFATMMPTSSQSYAIAKTKPGFTPRKDKRKGSDERQPTGARERNVAHPNGEEHSRVPKGNGIKRSSVIAPKIWAGTKIIGVGFAMLFIGADDATGLGVADDIALAPLSKIVWEAVLVFVEG